MQNMPFVRADLHKQYLPPSTKNIQITCAVFAFININVFSCWILTDGFMHVNEYYPQKEKEDLPEIFSIFIDEQKYYSSNAAL